MYPVRISGWNRSVGIWRVTGAVSVKTNEFRERPPMPWMRTVALPDLPLPRYLVREVVTSAGQKFRFEARLVNDVSRADFRLE